MHIIWFMNIDRAAVRHAFMNNSCIIYATLSRVRFNNDKFQRLLQSYDLFSGSNSGA